MKIDNKKLAAEILKRFNVPNWALVLVVADALLLGAGAVTSARNDEKLGTVYAAALRLVLGGIAREPPAQGSVGLPKH